MSDKLEWTQINDLTFTSWPKREGFFIIREEHPGKKYTIWFSRFAPKKGKLPKSAQDAGSSCQSLEQAKHALDFIIE